MDMSLFRANLENDRIRCHINLLKALEAGTADEETKAIGWEQILTDTKYHLSCLMIEIPVIRAAKNRKNAEKIWRGYKAELAALAAAN
jgi:hypothetical protein